MSENVNLHAFVGPPDDGGAAAVVSRADLARGAATVAGATNAAPDDAALLGLAEARAVARISSDYLLRTIHLLKEAHGGNLLDALIFQAIAQANVAHDGHLTREEAIAGFPLIGKHFDDIDADHKGYVTENDIRAWRTMRSAARRLAHRPPDKLKPVHAFQLHPPVQPRAMPMQTASVPARVPPAPRAVRVGD